MSWDYQIERWPRALPEFSIEKETTGLLLVDMQHFCSHEDYGLGKVLKKDFPDMYDYYYTRLKEVVIPNQVKLLNYFRTNNMRVIFLRTGPTLPDGSDYFTPRRYKDREAQKNGIKTNFHKGTFEHSLLPEFEPRENELVIDKSSVGAFNSTGIDSSLRKMGIDSLVIGGVATNACVETTARDAADRWYKCVLVEDACASFEKESHDASLRSFARLFGMVRQTTEIEKLLS